MNAYSTVRYLNQDAFIAMVTTKPETGLGWKAKLAQHGVSKAKIIVPPSPQMEEVQPDLWIVDDLDALRVLRARTSKPILAALPSQENHAKAHAFDLGADDCVLSNAGEDELVLRIGRLMRRAAQSKGAKELITGAKFDQTLSAWLTGTTTVIDVLRLDVTPDRQMWTEIEDRKSASMQTVLWSRISRLLPDGALCCRDADGQFRMALPASTDENANQVAQAIADAIAAAPLCLPTFDMMARMNPVVNVQTARRVPKPDAPKAVPKSNVRHLDNAPTTKSDRSALGVLQTRARLLGLDQCA